MKHLPAVTTPGCFYSTEPVLKQTFVKVLARRRKKKENKNPDLCAEFDFTPRRISVSQAGLFFVVVEGKEHPKLKGELRALNTISLTCGNL